MNYFISGTNRKLSIVGVICIIVGLFIVLLGSNSQEIPSVETTYTQISDVTSTLTSSAYLGESVEETYVTKVVDGDTFEIESGERVRLIGVDTPETVDPRRPIQCFGVEASFETKRLIEGKKVYLEKDVSETDSYGRLLRYVYVPLEDEKILFVNDYLLRMGFAKVVTYPPDVKYNQRFLEAEKEARESKIGLWQKC